MTARILRFPLSLMRHSKRAPPMVRVSYSMGNCEWFVTFDGRGEMYTSMAEAMKEARAIAKDLGVQIEFMPGGPQK